MENKKEVSILFYWNIVKKWKRFFLISIFSVTLAALIISLLLPKWYLSTASIKPSENAGMSFFSAVLGSKGLTSLGKSFNIGGLQYSDLDYYISILKSRRVTLEVIDRYNLQEKYGKEYIFQTIDALMDNSSFESDLTSNMLIMGVYDQHPDTAKAMLESYIKLLEENLVKLSKENLRLNKTFIEERYKQNMADIEKAEEALKEFQEEYGVIIPEEQFIATLEAISRLEAEKLLLESNLESLVRSYGEEAPQTEGISTRLSVLKNKLDEIVANAGTDGKDVFVGIAEAPELMNKYIKLYREVEIQNSLLEYIYPVYQEAKMSYEQDIPPFTIIDKPNLPEYKAKPKRAIIVIIGFILSVMFTVSYVFVVEYLRTLKQNSGR